MEKQIRDSGINFIGKIPWGTHFCQFYQAKDDLIDILVPYFKAGLENDEFCMWITSEPLTEQQIIKSVKKSVLDIDKYLKKGQLEILPYSQWYLKDGFFNPQRVLDGWVEKLNNALTKGFQGLRLTGNTLWLEQTHWRDFADYELMINSIIGNYRMIAICTYSIDKCGANEILDVMNTHQFAIIKREGNWKIIESSELKQTKQALQTEILECKQKEEFLQMAQVNAKIGLWDWFPQTNKLICSPELEALYGVTPGTIKTYQDWQVRVHPDNLRSINIELNDSIANHKPFDLQFRILYKSDQIRWISAKGKALYNEMGEVIHAFGINIDITDLKNIEENLKQKIEELNVLNERALYQSFLVDSVSEAIISADENFKILSWNKGAEKIYGWSEQEVISKNSIEILKSQIITGSRDQIIDILKENKTWTGEVIQKHKNGSDLHILSSTSIVFDKNKKINIYVSINRDISELKKAEKEIRELAQYPAQNPSPVFRVNSEKVLYVNSAGETVFRVKVGDLIPNPMIELVKQTFRDWKTLSADLDDHDKTYTVTIKPFKESNYANIYFVDITKRKEAERRLRNFVSTVTHELRTPLTVFIQSIQILKNYDTKLSKDQKVELLNTLQRSTDSFSELIENLLILAQFDESKAIDKAEAFIVFETIQEAVELIKNKYISKNINIIIEGDNSIQFLGDKKRFEELFRIFLDNSFKYSPNDSNIIITAVKSYQGKYNPNKTDGFLVKIEDFGVGIPKEDIPFLFERFFRSRNVRDKPGTGLGLAIASEIIKLFKGKIFVESELNKGTIFYLFIPSLKILSLPSEASFI